jgi:hypothetical protein
MKRAKYVLFVLMIIYALLFLGLKQGGEVALDNFKTATAKYHKIPK